MNTITTEVTNTTTTTDNAISIRPAVAPAYRSYNVRKHAFDARQATIAYINGTLTMVNWKHDITQFGLLVGLQDEALEHLILTDLVTTYSIGTDKAKRTVKSMQMFTKAIRDAYERREYATVAKAQNAPKAPKSAAVTIKSTTDFEKAQKALARQEQRVKAMQDAIRAYQTNGLSEPSIVMP